MIDSIIDWIDGHVDAIFPRLLFLWVILMFAIPINPPLLLPAWAVFGVFIALIGFSFN